MIDTAPVRTSTPGRFRLRRWLVGCALLFSLILLGAGIGLYQLWLAIDGPAHVWERWPDGQTPQIRQWAETLVPPPPSATWRDVARWGGDKLTPYKECVQYTTT